MKQLSRLMVSAVFAVVFGGLAWATPPRYASVYDTPIGINSTHLFLIRMVEDNEGSHYIRATRRFLVAQELETGHLDKQWLLEVVREDSVEIDNLEVRYADDVSSLDMFKVLADHRAVPVSFGPVTDWSDDSRKPLNNVSVDVDGIVDTASGINQQLLAADKATVRISASLDPTLNAIPDDPGPVNAVDYGPQAYSHDLADCFSQEVATNIWDYRVIRLDCENEGFDILSFAIYLTLKRSND